MVMEASDLGAGLQELAGQLGDQGLIKDAGRCARAGTDWRSAYQGPVLALARPETRDQAAAVVRWAGQHDVALVPQGGNSSLSGGSVPQAEGPPALILSCVRLRRIRHFDPKARLLVADTGLILEEVQRAVAPLEVPIDLGGRGSACLGGLLACHAGGLNVVRYGNLRAQVRGLEAVMPNGDIWHGLQQVRKDNTGYDLKSLLVGSEGTLGFLTAVAIQLHAAPAERLTCLLGLEAPAAALDIFWDLEALFPAQIYAAELMPAEGVRRGLAHNAQTANPFGAQLPPYVLLLEFGLREALLSQEQHLIFERLHKAPATPLLVAQNQRQRQTFWGLREGLVLAQSAYGPSLKHDVCVPLATVPRLLLEGCDLVRRFHPSVTPVPFGHLGDGSFHFNVTYEAGTPKAALQALTRSLHDLVHALGGSISAEHGLGQIRRDEARRLRDPVATQTMAAIKAALDPKGLFNPGKVLES